MYKLKHLSYIILVIILLCPISKVNAVVNHKDKIIWKQAVHDHISINNDYLMYFEASLTKEFLKVNSTNDFKGLDDNKINTFRLSLSKLRSEYNFKSDLLKDNNVYNPKYLDKDKRLLLDLFGKFISPKLKGINPVDVIDPLLGYYENKHFNLNITSMQMNAWKERHSLSVDNIYNFDHVFNELFDMARATDNSKAIALIDEIIQPRTGGISVLMDGKTIVNNIPHLRSEYKMFEILEKVDLYNQVSFKDRQTILMKLEEFEERIYALSKKVFNKKIVDHDETVIELQNTASTCKIYSNAIIEFGELSKDKKLKKILINSGNLLSDFSYILEATAAYEQGMMSGYGYVGSLLYVGIKMANRNNKKETQEELNAKALKKIGDFLYDHHKYMEERLDILDEKLDYIINELTNYFDSMYWHNRFETQKLNDLYEYLVDTNSSMHKEIKYISSSLDSKFLYQSMDEAKRAYHKCIIFSEGANQTIPINDFKTCASDIHKSAIMNVFDSRMGANESNYIEKAFWNNKLNILSYRWDFLNDIMRDYFVLNEFENTPIPNPVVWSNLARMYCDLLNQYPEYTKITFKNDYLIKMIEDIGKEVLSDFIHNLGNVESLRNYKQKIAFQSIFDEYANDIYEFREAWLNEEKAFREKAGIRFVENRKVNYDMSIYNKCNVLMEQDDPEVKFIKKGIISGIKVYPSSKYDSNNQCAFGTNENPIFGRIKKVYGNGIYEIQLIKYDESNGFIDLNKFVTAHAFSNDIMTDNIVSMYSSKIPYSGERYQIISAGIYSRLLSFSMKSKNNKQVGNKTQYLKPSIYFIDQNVFSENVIYVRKNNQKTIFNNLTNSQSSNDYNPKEGILIVYSEDHDKTVNDCVYGKRYLFVNLKSWVEKVSRKREPGYEHKFNTSYQKVSKDLNIGLTLPHMHNLERIIPNYVFEGYMLGLGDIFLYYRPDFGCSTNTRETKNRKESSITIKTSHCNVGLDVYIYFNGYIDWLANEYIDSKKTYKAGDTTDIGAKDETVVERMQKYWTNAINSFWYKEKPPGMERIFTKEPFIDYQRKKDNIDYESYELMVNREKLFLQREFILSLLEQFEHNDSKRPISYVSLRLQNAITNLKSSESLFKTWLSIVFPNSLLSDKEFYSNIYGKESFLIGFEKDIYLKHKEDLNNINIFSEVIFRRPIPDKKLIDIKLENLQYYLLKKLGDMEDDEIIPLLSNTFLYINATKLRFWPQ
jgi:hypothetical protein